MRLIDKFAGGLLWSAAIVLVAGVIVTSPGGGSAAAALAALFSLVPLVFGSKRRRIFAGIILGVSILMEVPAYFEEKRMLKRGRELQQQKEGVSPTREKVTSWPGKP